MSSPLQHKPNKSGLRLGYLTTKQLTTTLNSTNMKIKATRTAHISDVRPI